MSFHLNINGHARFATVEQARTIGQAVKVLLESGEDFTGALYIDDPANGFTRHALVKPTFDRSRVVRGGQDAAAKVEKLTAFIENLRTDAGGVSADEFWDEFNRSARNTGEVDMERFSELVEQRLGDPEAASEAVLGAVADFAQGEVRGLLRQRENARRKAEKIAAQQATQNKNKKNRNG